ncbi:MAG: protein translocase subunit SecF [Bdellovibrionaceae bacterium]|jgi:preprotein translocase subunit SecF|nr:protein translocase subunit SecF [Pseudobdellovibrionaceae bacterium]
MTKNSKHEFGKYDFLSKAGMYMAISSVIVLVSLGVMFSKGFSYGIDFSGGTEIQVKFEQEMQTSIIRDYINKLGYNSASVQNFGEGNEFLIRMGSLKGKTEKETNYLLNTMIKKVSNGITDSYKTEGALIRRVDSVGPQIGSELKRNGLLAAFYSFLMILIYVGLRFDYKYAPGAVICLVHDALITLGIFSLFQREVNVQTMAAILTIIGYSLNDTIVTFDRIRENVTLYKGKTFKFIINKSLNDVLSRTMLTSVTTLLAVLVMYFMAGGVISDFAFTLAIGVVVGTYSSIFVASPLVLMFDRIQNK